MSEALPASGKSETRRYLKTLTAEDTKKFHLGETSTQVDDFPYVDGMKKIDEAAIKVFGHTIFFNTTDFNLFNDYDWATLIYLINDDYFDILECNPKIPSKYEKDPVDWLFNRYDVASVKTGQLPARFFNLKEKYGEEKFNEFKKECYPLCNTLLHDKYEFARGGTKGETAPLKPPFGYEFSLSCFDKKILSNAAILYIWVTPEESRRKNNERANPDDPGSNLFHGVPINVMLGDYGCDDMSYLIEHTEKPHTITVKKGNDVKYIPIGIFDNRVDKTSFLRGDISNWKEDQIIEMTNSIKTATDTMWAEYNKD